MIKEFLATKKGEQLYSFLKTYVTVFLIMYLAGVDSGKDMFDLSLILYSAKYSLLSVIRNIYKLITE